MLKRITGGLFVLAFLIGTLGTLSIGVSVGAAGGSSVSMSCMKGGYARYVDEGGDRFPDEQICVGWVADHPGQPPIAVDDSNSDDPNA